MKTATLKNCKEKGGRGVVEPSEQSDSRARAILSDVAVWCRFDEAVDITTLVENPRNPNKHPDKQIALLAKIIRHQGWRQPITVSKRSGFIVKGHGRLQAAKVLNVESVPVEYQDYANEAAEMADLLADNRLAELAEPDNEGIQALLNDAALFEGFDLDFTGFDDEFRGAFDVQGIDAPELADGDRNEIQQMTFTLHQSQIADVNAAIQSAKERGAATSDINDNSNGNALAWICLEFLNAGK